MTGKAYNIREMKAIVDYLIENKLFGEIRGRKMWMDFANSQLTTRTWQSLKETFLKRILPDIHNPYYKLDMEQINSFRAGYDVGERNKNKLEIHAVSDDSSSNGPTQDETAQPNNGNGIKEEKIAGENIKSSKIPSRSRSSADTIIVETCYETAEDIQKDLESPRPQEEVTETKSFRDCITYSEPLTPMLQEVLDDFQSEPENEPEASDRENQLEIITSEPATDYSDNVNQGDSNVETESGKINNVDNSDIKKTGEPISVEESDKKTENNQQNNDTCKKTQDIVSDVKKDSEVVCLDDSPAEDNDNSNEVEKNAENETQNATKEQAPKNDEIPDIKDPQNPETVEIPVSSENSEITPSLNNSNNTTDASLPNNPEALKKRNSNENQKEKPVASENKTVNKISRKRSNSEAVQITDNKKTKLDKIKMKATSDTESRKVPNTIGKSQPKGVKPKEKQMEIDSIPENKNESNSSKIAQNLAETLEKPSTSKADDGDSVLLTSGTDQSGDVNDSVEVKNPCLQNVSLFDEQFKTAKYNISESSDADKNEQQKKTEVTENKPIQEKPNEVVLLKSNTESDTEGPSSPPPKKQRAGVGTSKKDRDRALGNVFGFIGASQSKRKRQLSRRRRTISQNTISHNNGDSNSSEWTSDADGDMFVSPPRGRKNRQTKKYLRPQSGRILSLEEEGGLFVMYGKKIFPLVKDGKMVKNYLTYLPESESEEEESYWKMKYEEEKKKSDDLKKLLEKAKDPQSRKSTSAAATEQPDPLRKSTCNHDQPQEHSNNSGKEICLPEQEEKKEVSKTNASENIKIRFTTKNDQEIHLEGNWPQIHNVLEHVVHIFHKEPQPISEYKARPVVEPPSSSGISTPVVITAIKEPSVDPEVHEKVNKIESEIFKEIEERDKEEQVQPNGQEINVTKRKPGRPRKSSQSSTSQSPAKRPKTSDQPETEAEENSTNITPATNNENNVITDTTKRQIRTPRKILNESLNETKTIQTRRSKVKLDTSNAGNDNDIVEGEVRYMLPPRTRQSIKSAAEKNTRDMRSHKSTTQVPKIISSPDTTCPNSMESTLGYQDSDPSPMKIDLRKKKRMNVFDVKSKAISHLRRSVRNKTQTLLYCDESSTSPVGVSIKKIEQDNSTLNSDVYKSESYQLLMPQAKSSFKQLEQIDEASPTGNEIDSIEHLYSTSKNEVFSVQINTNYNSRTSGQINSDVGSSSNMSLPLSPELSMVESMSISKDLLNGLDDGPSINEMQCNDEIKDPANCSHYLMTNVDVSVPLMEQECELTSCNIPPNESDRKDLVTKSLLSKIGTFNIEDGTNLTDTLDIKLRDLLLESAKKMAMENENKIDNMEVDDTNVDVEVQKKVKNRKRCSTPRKRKDSQKSKKIPKVQTVIEEEHIEAYSQGGRKSCPPIIQALAAENTVVNEEINIADLTIDDNAKPKGRKKKDVIKVKIIRPKRRKSQTNTSKSVKEISMNSIYTDSGINDTESGVFLPVNESVDLIHNHSETCLLANECVGDSVEFVENSMKSVLSLGDSMQSCDNDWNSQYEFNDGENISPDLFCNNAQDVNSFYKPNVDDIQSGGETVYHSPIGTELSSLVTEDLSDDPPQLPDRPNRWYLLSDDETTNTNMAKAPDSSANIGSFGANLKEIFPMTYAVPDLSTITEMSRENDDNSRKPTLEGLTGNGFNSHSIFDSNSCI